MFVTITLNPAVDCSLLVSGVLQIGSVHKTVSETITPGGKGVNVAKVIAGAGQKVVAGGLLGISDFDLYSSFLSDLGVESDFLPVDHETRRNIMAVDESGNELKLNRQGFPGLVFDWPGLRNYCSQLARKGDVFVVSGSLPSGFPDDTYARLVKFFRDAGKFVALDASGPALVSGLSAGPDVIKPNMAEISEITGIAAENETEIVKLLCELSQKHRAVIISDGSKGAWFASKKKVYFGTSPHVRALDTTGAGDSMLGRFCAEYFGVSRCVLSERVMRVALAAGAAAVELKGTPAPDPGRIEELAGCVEIREIVSERTEKGKSVSQ